MIVTLVGWLGADAKETDKGFNFSLSQKTGRIMLKVPFGFHVIKII